MIFNYKWQEPYLKTNRHYFSDTAQNLEVGLPSGTLAPSSFLLHHPELLASPHSCCFMVAGWWLPFQASHPSIRQKESGKGQMGKERYAYQGVPPPPFFWSEKQRLLWEHQPRNFHFVGQHCTLPHPQKRLGGNGDLALRWGLQQCPTHTSI